MRSVLIGTKYPFPVGVQHTVLLTVRLADELTPQLAAELHRYFRFDLNLRFNLGSRVTFRVIGCHGLVLPLDDSLMPLLTILAQRTGTNKSIMYAAYEGKDVIIPLTWRMGKLQASEE